MKKLAVSRAQFAALIVLVGVPLVALVMPSVSYGLSFSFNEWTNPEPNLSYEFASVIQKDAFVPGSSETVTVIGDLWKAIVTIDVSEVDLSTVGFVNTREVLHVTGSLQHTAPYFAGEPDEGPILTFDFFSTFSMNSYDTVTEGGSILIHNIIREGHGAHLDIMSFNDHWTIGMFTEDPVHEAHMRFMDYEFRLYGLANPPIPEPSTLLLLGSGLVGLGGMAWRRNRKG